MMFKYVCLALFITWYQLSADGHPAKTDVRSIDSMIDKETEAFLSVEAEESSHNNVRDKRTVGFLRQLFPGISQIIDRKIQQITRFLFRVVGRLVLRGGGAGAGGAAGGGGAAGETTSRRISITLPTYPPSTDDEEEDGQQDVPAATEVPAIVEMPVATEAPAAAAPEAITEGLQAFRSAITEVTSGLDIRITTEGPVADSAPAASADSAVEMIAITTTAAAAVTAATPTTVAATTAATTTAAVADVTTTTMATTTAAATAAAITTTNSPTTQRPSDSDNTVGTGIVKRTARDVSAEESNSSPKKSPLIDTDNDEIASSDKVLSKAASDDVSSLTADVADEDPRNKRFLLNSGGGGGSGGGSGNFLFDLIRLVAGSGANQDRDESSNIAPVEAESAVVQDVNSKEDGYSVGVPGPLTRIFVIANRGVANLVQDLILRLAQTTERIVNFKARLITSLI
ncbi:Hypothetical protein CINCED_3A017856 [Cinara cedri]|uniref:Uncharacterized protein n=2 Tax=Cinara cedri TaxID=506608 RepID=A0A5E4N1U7_9HEMI|nr:Hypothetical protein CINCED_3A017856 [Cinara cedri]